MNALTRIRSLLSALTPSLLALSAVGLLSGCLTGGNDRFTTAQMLSARWLPGDSLMLYSALYQSGDGDHYETSVVKITRIRVGPEGFAFPEIIHQQGSVVGCADMRLEDSLVFYSYVPLSDEVTGKWGRNCSDPAGGSPGHATRLFVGRIDGNPVLSADTASLRARLLERPREHTFYAVDSGIVPGKGQNSKEIFCVGEACIGPD